MRTRKRIGYGSLDWDGFRNSKVWLKNEFLKTIEKLEPKKEKGPLRDLAKQPFELYVNFVEKQDKRSVSRRRQVFQRWESSGSLSFFSLLNEDDPLKKSILQWGETYQLNTDWCFRVALLSLQEWHQFKTGIGERFKSLPFYSHLNYLGFGSLVMVHKLASMEHESLSEEQKALVDSFSEESKQLVESFNEQWRTFLSYYPYDPHIMTDKFILDQIEGLISALPSVNHVLPVLNLLQPSDLDKLRSTLHERAKELIELLKKTARRITSANPMQVGADELIKHLEWAARYQVFNEGFYSIEKYKYKHQSDRHSASMKVRKAVRALLGRIDLNPRPTTRGRKRAL